MISEQVAAAPAVGGGKARNQCPAQQRDEKPERSVGGSLARLVGGLPCGSLGFLGFRLRACKRVAHALFSVGLRDTCALGDELDQGLSKTGDAFERMVQAVPA